KRIIRSGGSGGRWGRRRRPLGFCVPAQNGFGGAPPTRDRRTTSPRPPILRGGTGSSRPSGVTIFTGPCTTSGPFGFGVIRVSSGMPQLYHASPARGVLRRRPIDESKSNAQTARDLECCACVEGGTARPNSPAKNSRSLFLGGGGNAPPNVRVC